MKITCKRAQRQNGLIFPRMINLRACGVKRAVKLHLALVTAAMILFVGCDVKETIYNTPHPESGKITLTVNWSGIGEGYSIPESYTVQIGDYKTTLSGTTNTIDHLFAPGTYDVLVYHNSSAAVEVDGTTAIMKSDLPIEGNLFSCGMQVEIAKDSDHAFTAVMRQQLRQLTLLIEPTGESSDKIEAIKQCVPVADKLNLVSGTYADQTSYTAEFSKITEGPDAGKWSVTFPVLGVLSNQPTVLEATISFTYDNLDPLVVKGNLTDALAGFNDDKTTPMTLGMTVPVDVAVSAVGWERVAQGIYPPLVNVGVRPVLNLLLSSDGSEYQTFCVKRPEIGTYALQTAPVTDVTSWEKKIDDIVFREPIPGMLPVIVQLDQMVRFKDMLLVAEYLGQYRFFQSANGGTDWSELEINGEKVAVRAVLGEVGRTGYLTVLGGKTDRYFYRTRDLVTWERSGQQVPDDFPDMNFAKISTTDDLTLVGGAIVNGLSKTALNTTWSTEDGLNWIKHETVPFDEPREGASGAMCNDIFYLIGGTDANGHTTEDILYSNNRGRTWHKVVMPPGASNGYSARSYSAVQVEGQNSILIFSGRKTSLSSWLNEIWRLTPKVISEGEIIVKN